MRFPDVVVVGGINIDHSVRGPVLPAADRPVVGDVFLRTVGGKGLNQAVAAARLGARVALVARVGADAAGREALLSLRHEGVVTSHVLRDRAGSTGAAVLHIDGNGRKQTAAAPGVNLRLTPAQIDATRMLMTRARVLLAQLEVPLRAVDRALRMARAAGVYTVLDPSPRQQIPTALLRFVDAISANHDEATEITGIRVNGRRSARRAAGLLAAQGPGLVVIGTPEGRLVFQGGGAEWLENIDVPVVDTTGAGDACAAALAVAVARGHDGWAAARDGHCAAAVAVTRLGGYPSLPRPADLRSLRARLEGV